jgi:hypothetical protein
MKYIQRANPIVHLHDTIKELDPIVSVLQSRRFTFTEADALGALWAQGEEVRLREDARFWQLESGHWHLAAQKLANDLLVERLRKGDWEGRELEAYLLALDEQLGGFHVFCPIDSRLTCLDGTWRLTYEERLPVVSADQKAQLDALVNNLYEKWRIESNAAPWQTQQIITVLNELGWNTSIEDLIGFVTAWLFTRADWARVAQDLWLPRADLPVPQPPKILTVLPVHAKTLADGQSLTKEQTDADGPFTPSEHDDSNDLPSPPVTRDANDALTWRFALRTIHLINGYLPIPPEARTLYPTYQEIARTVALQGIWYEDAARFRVWLNCENNWLFGDALAERIGLLDAGTILRIKWDKSGILFTFEGVDEIINHEEARLADPEALAQLRRGLGESYRQSLRTILTEQVEGLSATDLYRRLCERQRHTVHRGSFQAVLTASPEFYRTGRIWKIKPDVNGEDQFRATLVKYDIPADKPLSGLLRKAQQQIASLIAA